MLTERVGSYPLRNGPIGTRGRETHPIRKRGPVGKQYVAVDLHRRRSLIVREDEGGEEVGVVRIDNDPVAFSLALAEAWPDPEVAIEACYGWYWDVDVLQADGARVHLVNPRGCSGAIGGSRTTAGSAGS